MNGHDIDSIVNQAQEEQQSVTDLAQQTVDWFISDSRIGNAYPIEEATQELSKYLDVGYHEASRAISSVVGDIVDPVQLITLSDGKYVGVFEYNVYSESGAYGYIHYDDKFGKLKRVVCAKCVQDHILDENVIHATQGLGTASDDASWTNLIDKIEQHYDNAHEAHPKDIEPGAALVSGTTISGNTAFHTGNESSITHDNISGGTTGNPHADSLSTSYSAPVQSVNSQTGDVTISTGSAIGGSVTNYSDLPFNLSERQFYYVSSEQDVVVQTNANLDVWKSISDFTTVASAIPDGGIAKWTYEGDVADSWFNNNGTNNGATFVTDSQEGSQAIYYNEDGTLNDYVDIPDIAGGLNAISYGGYFKLGGGGGGTRPTIIGGSNRQFQIYDGRVGGNGWNFEINFNDTGGKIAEGSNTYTNGTWIFLVAVYDASGLGDGSTVKIYRNDGNEIASGSPATNNINNNSLRQGVSENNIGDSWEGPHDDVRAYAKRLTNTEVSN
jgi:hypothetical protein